MIDLVILAAGASTRMGHPKALTRIGDESALERIVRMAAGFRIHVVVGAHESEIRAALPDLDVVFVRNPRPESGRTGSLQRGLLGARGDALVLPVDHPLVRAETLRLLAREPDPWVVPTFAGRGGHPIKLGALGIAAVMGAPASTPLRDVPRTVGLEVTRVAVDDPGVIANLDTPADVLRLSSPEPEGI